MIRIIARRSDCGAAANVGGPVDVTHRTFDLQAPALEAWLRERTNTYQSTEVIGAEVIDDPVSEATTWAIPCPSAQCPFCTGDACRQHLAPEPCDCGTIERHTDPVTNQPAKPEPPALRTVRDDGGTVKDFPDPPLGSRP